MKSPAGSIVVGAGLALLAGCTTRPLQPDAGGSGSLGIDAGTIGDVGGAAIDGPLFSGRRSFIVTSTLVPTDGGTTDFPLSHTFTMVIDGDKLTEFSGQGPYPIAAQLQPTAGGFRIVGVFAFNLVPGCTGRDVNYSDVSFRFDPSGRLLGVIAFPEQPANVTFGGPDLRTLYVTARTSLYTVPMEATGHRAAQP